MPNEIQVFTNAYVAMIRPRKGTYCIFQYHQNTPNWKPFTRDIAANHLGLYTSGSDPATVKLQLHRRTSGYETPNDQRNLYRFCATGLYLLWSAPNVTHAEIPILSIAPGQTIPGKFTKKEHRIVGTPLVRQANLWQLRQEAPQQPKPRATNPMPKHIVQLIAENAVSHAEQCPITMDDITLDNASVTSCYHVFNHSAITKWFEKESTCPVCKTECTAIKAV